MTLVQKTLEALWVDELPPRLIGDKAYDSDPLDQQLAEQGIDMIAPPIAATGASRVPKTDVSCVAIGAAGRSSGSSPGCRITGAWWCAMSGMLRTTALSLNWAASSFC